MATPSREALPQRRRDLESRLHRYENAPPQASGNKSAREIDAGGCSAGEGRCREEARRLDALTIVHPDMRGMVSQRAARRLQGKEQPSRYQIKRRPREGKTRGSQGLNSDAGPRRPIIRPLNP